MASQTRRSWQNVVDNHVQTLQSLHMTTTQPLRPSLWRTCRVIANRNRLRIFGCLVRQPDQTVSAIARRLQLSVPVASQYLRALESRGLLTVRRVGSRVYYRISAGEAPVAIQPLVAALRHAFERSPNPVEFIFKQATAFTHPRRVAIYQAVDHGAQTVDDLHARLRISRFAAARHLAKLEARKFVAVREDACVAVQTQNEVARALAKIAMA